MLAFDQVESTLCCCKHHIPHDESLKFIMTATEENLKIEPFKDNCSGTLMEHNETVKYKLHFNPQEVYFRNDVI